MKKANALKLISLLMLIVLIITVFAVPVSGNQIFTDLSPEHWCYSKIIDFEKKGYVCGYEDDTFRPDRTITRAEYVKIVNNFFGYELELEKDAGFNDVSSGDWFAPYVNEAVERGYITGYEDGTFKPQDPIRRQEATVILARILGIDDEKYPENHQDGLAQYSDGFEVQEWARVAIHSYSVYNFINGYEDGTLRIMRNVTRAETVELLHILEQKVVIDKEGGGSTSIRRVKQPVITAYEMSGEEKTSVQGWVNYETRIENGSLVEITCETKDAIIYYSIDNGEEKIYSGAFELTDGKHTIKARAEKKAMSDSTTAIMNVEIDTIEPIVAGIEKDEKVMLIVTDHDKFNIGKENISGLNDNTLEYAWFTKTEDGYVRETLWTSFQNGEEINCPEFPGIYYLGVKGEDIAENKMGQANELGQIDDKVDLSNVSGETSDEKPTDEPYVIVTENQKESDNDGESGEEIIPPSGEVSGEIPLPPSGENSGDVPVEPGEDPIVIVVKADVTVNHIYDDKNTFIVKAEAVPGSEYTAIIIEDPNYTHSGDTSIEVSRYSDENIINVYYTRIKVYVTYNGTTATSGEMSGDVVSAGDTMNLSANEFEKIGYTFAGWSLVSGDEEITYIDEAEFSGDPENTEVTLYAVWTANEDTKYVVEYYTETLNYGEYVLVESGEMSGTTDTTAEIDTTREFTGFTFDVENANNVLSGNIEGDGSLVLKAYYTRNTYTLTLVEGENIASVSGEGTYKYEETVEIDATLGNDAGYTYSFANWTSGEDVFATSKVTEVTMPAGNVTLTANASKTANEDTKYVVEYYTETLSDGEYILVESGEMSGTTDTTAEIDTTREFTGFTFDVENANNVLSGNIEGDGSLVLKAYYTRNTYTLTLVEGENIASVSGEGTYKYEETVEIDATLGNDAGYTYSFANWISGEDIFATSKVTEVTMPAGNVTLTANASKTANGDTKYVVEYYTETLTTGRFTKVDSEELTGETDTTAEIDTTREFTGFTFDVENANNVLSGNIEGDGSLVLKAYYTRNTYTLTLVEGENIASVSGEGTYKYEETVEIDATLGNDAGYTYSFANWTSGEDVFATSKAAEVTMPAGNVTLTANASKTANEDTKYVVEYYTETLNDGEYVLAESGEMSGTTDTTAEIDTTREFTGFTFDVENANNVLSGNIEGDGSLVLKAYYTRNTYTLTLVEGENIASVSGEGTYKFEETVNIDATLGNDAGYTYSFANWTSGEDVFATSKATEVTMPAGNVTLIANASKTANGDTKYVVEYYTETLTTGRFTKVDSEELTGETDTTAEIDTTREFEGFTFDADNAKNVLSGNIEGDGSLVLKAYYTRNTYTLTLVEGENISSVTGAGTYKYEETVEIDATLGNDAGYTYSFTNWTSGEDVFATSKVTEVTMPAGNVTLTANASKTANEDTKYVVEYYTETLTTGRFTKVDSEELTGETDTTAEIDTTREFVGFTFDVENENNVLSGNIEGDGSLVLKAYYTRNTYTLTLVEGENILSVTGAGTYKYEETVEIDATLGNDAGYTYSFANWTSGEDVFATSKVTEVTMPAGNVTLTANASKTANEDTKYVVEYYTETLTTGRFTKVDSEELTGETDTTAEIDTTREFTGFTFDSENANNVLSGNIEGDGSLVLKAYYTRNTYTLTLVEGENISSVTGAGTYKYEETVEIDATLGNDAGYTYSFVNWTSGEKVFATSKATEVTMPAGNVTLMANASKTANEDTKYIVEHYKEDLNADTFTKVDTDKLNGKTGENATFEVNDYDGFTYDSTKTEPSDLTILGDGSLVIKLYYARNSYTLTLVAGENVASVTGDGEYEYGENVEISAVLENDSRYEYDFTKWESSDVELLTNKTTQNTTFNMPAGNITLTAIASKEEKTPNVTIKTFVATNFPDSNNKQAEPGDEVDYNLIIKNNENYDVTVKSSFTTDGTLGDSFVVTYKDGMGNVIKTETVQSFENITIPSNGTVEITFSSTVDDNHSINSDFDTKVTLKTTSDKKITDKTASVDVQKSADILSPKNKNVILILDLSGSMKACIKHNNLDTWGNQTYCCENYRRTRINKLKTSAKAFTDMLKADAEAKGSDITLTIIGIGNLQSYDNSGMYDYMGQQSYAYKIGSYTKSSWVPATKFTNLSAGGGTNITGSLTLAQNIIKNENNYRSRYNVNYISDADTFTVLLTDGANGVNGNTAITGNEAQVKYVRNNSNVFAIGFGPDASTVTAKGYKDLYAVTDDASVIYRADSETALDDAFEAIAKRIAEEQSISGIIEVNLPADGKYFPIKITSKDCASGETLATINYISELEANNITISESGDKLYWDVSGTAFSDKEDLKLELNLDEDATDGMPVDEVSLMNYALRELNKESEISNDSGETKPEVKPEIGSGSGETKPEVKPEIGNDSGEIKPEVKPEIGNESGETKPEVKPEIGNESGETKPEVKPEIGSGSGEKKPKIKLKVGSKIAEKKLETNLKVKSELVEKKLETNLKVESKLAEKKLETNLKVKNELVEKKLETNSKVESELVEENKKVESNKENELVEKKLETKLKFDVEKVELKSKPVLLENVQPVILPEQTILKDEVDETAA